MGRKIWAQSKKNPNGERSCPGDGEPECKQKPEEGWWKFEEGLLPWEEVSWKTSETSGEGGVTPVSGTTPGHSLLSPKS